MKGTTRRRVERAWQFAVYRLERGFAARVEFWGGTKQGLGVGVLWTREELFGWGKFDDSPEVHYRHAVRDMTHKSQIMCHEHHGQMQALLQLEQQIHDLGLNADIKCTNEFVGNQGFGFDG